MDSAILAGHGFIDPPFALGHKCVARVTDVGDDVTTVTPGDLVVVPWSISCSTCAQCRGGHRPLQLGPTHGDRGMSWCVGSFPNLYTGQAGAAANADTRAGGTGGAPGVLPPSSCGAGGSGSANGLAHQHTESLPGADGCVVLTY
ncbi:alcohol dehydrogenase catalytic domain-containing protein [Streptomyces sp. NPDC058718]|uniref:alcohol dehydrogenase catalytic domain-containing protein n=1 Tax=Streptomyces sp. NPDC058718 TaxID=3346610 RepID=UPI00368E2FFB